MKKKCIIIPAYNEDDNIIRVISGIKRTTIRADIIVIDDASKDHTVEKAKEGGAIVLLHPFNMGYGAALQTGYKYAVKNQYECLVQLDGDGQHDPKHIPDLFKLIELNDCDVVLGSRFLEKTDFKVGILKSIGIGFFRFIIQKITGEKITDPTSGYQCLSREVFNAFRDNTFPCDYPDANVIIMLHRLGFKIKEIPVDMYPNPSGRSMHRGIHTVMYYLFKMFLSIFIILIREKSVYHLKE